MATRKSAPKSAPKAAVKVAVAKSASPAKAVKRTVAAPAAPVAPDATVAAPAGKPKHKLVRDSFTIPKSEYAVIDALKLRATQLTRPTKKSEILRAGVVLLNALADDAFLAALNAVPSLKTGRPQSDKAAAADKAVADKD
jgi:hypothetical protein